MRGEGVSCYLQLKNNFFLCNLMRNDPFVWVKEGPQSGSFWSFMFYCVALKSPLVADKFQAASSVSPPACFLVISPPELGSVEFPRISAITSC